MAGDVQIGTRSVLFTDLVGSTELRVRLGEEAADALRRAHDALVVDAITAHGGTVVKGLGDGAMATFEAAADAVAAAVAVQQAVDAHGRRTADGSFEVRVGLSTGDVSREDGDVFGVPVIEAARLCAAARGGEILAAELVRALTRGRGGFSFEPMGDLALKGLAEPVEACRVVWEPLLPSAAGSEPVPISPALLGVMATAYVGRDELRDRLGAVWQAARSGSTRTVLLAGEPGVGKTRTAAELARTAFGDSALVLFGRCDEDLGVPYQPFVEALEHYVAHAAQPRFGRLPGELRRLVPELGPTVPPTVRPVVSDPASEEHRLFEATTSWLVECATTSEGCLLVLDDLHWATKPTLQLLQHLVRTASALGAPLLVVATYRDTDVDRAHPLAAAIGDLRRLPGVERLAVDNLTDVEVLQFIEAAAGHDLDEPIRRLAGAVHAETEGNPFFVGEVLRHLVETGGVRRQHDRWVVAEPDEVSVPEGVRDVVGRRLSRLSDGANEVLGVAAVVGRDFDVDVLLGLIDRDEGEMLDALDEAVRARLVEEVGPDRFRFAHALVRTTLYDELTATRRRRLHRRVADVLEKVRPDDVRALAHHCTEGGPEGGDVSRALRYTLAAAEDSLGARAFADAEARFRAALELLEEAEDPRSTLWVHASCGLGECLRDQGDPSFREVLLGASRRALELGDRALATRSALANSRGFSSVVGGVDTERLEVIEQTLDLLDPAPSASRARLLGLLSSELTFSEAAEDRLRLAQDAVAMARALGDDRLLGDVLAVTSYSRISGARLEEETAEGRDAVRLADAHGDPAQRVVSRIFLSGSLMTAGQLEEAARYVDEAFRIGSTEAAPLARWIAIANWVRPAVLAGDLDEAQARNDAMLALSQDLGQEDGLQWWGAAALGIQWLRGVYDGMVDGAREMQVLYPRQRLWSCALAWTLSEQGEHEPARAVLDAAELEPSAHVHDPMPFVAISQLALAAFELDDAPLAGRVIDALAPHRDRWAHYYLFVMGPLRWYGALADAVVGRLDEAADDLRSVIGDLDRRGLRAHVPRAQLHLARILRRRGGPGDLDEAAALLDAVRRAAAELGLAGLPALTDAAAR